MCDFLKLSELVSESTTRLYERKRQLHARRVYEERYEAFSDNPAGYLAGIREADADGFLASLMAGSPDGQTAPWKGFDHLGRDLSIEAINGQSVRWTHPDRENPANVGSTWIKVTRPNGTARWFPPVYFTADPDDREGKGTPTRKVGDAKILPAADAHRSAAELEARRDREAEQDARQAREVERERAIG
jgi:hypothetical protein